MKTLHFSIQISAPRKHVWNVMLSDQTYREWAALFMEGSHFVGNWQKNSKMQFLSPTENKSIGGMVSIIADNVTYELISIKHRGLVTEGKEDTSSDEARKWVGFEKYRFMEEEGKTELQVEVDVINDFVIFMKETWPRALQKIKELSEG